MRKLVDPNYLAFPFRVMKDAPLTSRREAHVAEVIEQVLFTDPQERVFRPHFGAGVRALVFEPNSNNLRALARDRLMASLTEALQGEVDPKTLDVSLDAVEERLTLTVSYRLAAIDRVERHRFEINEGGLG